MHGLFCVLESAQLKIDRVDHSNDFSTGFKWPTQVLVFCLKSLRWRHNDHDGVSNHLPHHCLLNCLFGRRSKKTSKLRVTGLCAGNSPGTGEFPAQMASNAENVSIWWLHQVQASQCLGLSFCFSNYTGVKQCTFHWLVSSELVQKQRVSKSLIIHHLIVITCSSYGNVFAISVPKSLIIILIHSKPE